MTEVRPQKSERTKKTGTGGGKEQGSGARSQATVRLYGISFFRYKA